MKDDLVRYLQRGREALVWKLEGLSEYDSRRPMVKTGTNLLGLVKHMAGVESDYFGSVFGRPFPELIPWTLDDAEENSDLWATPDESTAFIVGLYRRVWVHSDSTIEALELDAPGVVRWWPADRQHTTLHLVLSHVVAETQRHAGHADIIRELIDGAIGLRPDVSNLNETADWDAHRERLEIAAREAR